VKITLRGSLFSLSGNFKIIYRQYKLISIFNGQVFIYLWSSPERDDVNKIAEPPSGLTQTDSLKVLASVKWSLTKNILLTMLLLTMKFNSIQDKAIYINLSQVFHSTIQFGC